MSNFFDKLTGSGKGSRATANIAVAPREEVKVRMQPEPQHKLKIEAEKEEPEEEEEESSPAEEEGELTVDIYDRGDSLVIQSTVAGVKPEDLDVSISSDMVVIKGRRERQEEIREDSYYYKELFWGTFSRSVILPEEIDDAASEASLKYGLLTIRLPKKKRGVTQKLKVKVT